MTELGGAAGGPGASSLSGDSRAVPPVVDVAISVGLAATGMVARSATTAYRLVQPFATLILQPPVLPERYWPQRGIDRLADRGERARRQACASGLGAA